MRSCWRACAGDDDDDDAALPRRPRRRRHRAGDATPPAPAGATAGEVVVGAVLEPTSLDIVTVAGAALDQVLLDNVYETLLTLDDDG